MVNRTFSGLEGSFMKRIFSILLAATILCLSLCGCSSEDPMKEEMQARIGVNQEITGAYDEALADIEILVGTNCDECRYWINEMGYSVPALPKTLVYRMGMPFMYENNLKVMSEEEKDLVDRFMALHLVTAFFLNPYIRGKN